MSDTLSQDVAKIAAIDAVPTILDVVCKITGMGFAAVARVTDDRWIACAVRDDIGFGLKPSGELEIKTTICNDIRESRQAVIIDNVAEDPVFRDHHTPKIYGLQSYISMPIVLPDGRFFGTLCAIDPRPAKVSSPEVTGMFKLFADLIAFHLDTQDKLAASEAALLDAREAAELREQFIAVLGHDLRNPLASIDAGARLLERKPLDEGSASVLGMMHKSVQRMGGLINNILDFARGRLGGGLGVQLSQDDRFEDALRHVVAELGSASPGRVIVTDMNLEHSVEADTARISQLFSNLLGNALTHGAADKPVVVGVSTGQDHFTLSVANAGSPIPEAAMKQLFQPFTRNSTQGGQEGLGLGLYIASEIARAHGGRIDATSNADQTRFTFRMPLQAASSASATADAQPGVGA